MTKAFDIVGYTFQGQNFCPDCIIDALPTGDGEAFDGWKLAPGFEWVTTEENLTEIAEAFQIDRMDESTFDSGDFPKVIFSSQVEDIEYCESCHNVIDGE